MIRIAVDAMGGDNAPIEIVKGVIEAASINNSIEITLVGNVELLKEFELPSSGIKFHHADRVIGMNDSAVARDIQSSISVGVNLVKSGAADSFVSAGNTGACMAQAVFGLKRIPGIIRPAIPTPIPVGDKYLYLIDAGANVDSKSEHLLQFAIMGSVYTKQILNIENPRVAILSNGQEKKKGNKLTSETYDLLSDSSLNFVGYVEGNSMFYDHADVVVCDGFVGNIVLKVCEGIASSIIQMAGGELHANGIEKSIMEKVFMSLKKKMDYSEYGGAPLLGVNGNCVICHGSSLAKAIRNAILHAAKMKEKNINNIIQEEIGKYF